MKRGSVKGFTKKLFTFGVNSNIVQTNWQFTDELGFKYPQKIFLSGYQSQFFILYKNVLAIIEIL